MRTRSAATAQKLMNLYRNAFAIDGSWKSVNPIFMAEADDMVVPEIAKLPCGKILNMHISNLRSGRTNIDSIDSELLPYGGMMSSSPSSSDFSDSEFSDLMRALETFQPDAQHLDGIKSLPIVRRFGERWRTSVRSILPDGLAAQMWRNVVQADGALRLWSRAAEILSSPPSEKLRAEVQADLPEYETYLPMFGADGLDLLTRLRTFVNDK